MERIPQASQGARHTGRALDHLRCLPGARRTRSGVLSGRGLAALHRHWYRNIFSHVPPMKVREVAAMLKAIHASEDVAAARGKAQQVIEKLRALRLTKAAELAEAAVEETLTYYAFPEEHWRRVRTNNPLERLLREIRRRTRVGALLPCMQRRVIRQRTSRY
jgi:transposase-like protein